MIHSPLSLDKLDLPEDPPLTPEQLEKLVIRSGITILALENQVSRLEHEMDCLNLMVYGAFDLKHKMPPMRSEAMKKHFKGEAIKAGFGSLV